VSARFLNLATAALLLCAGAATAATPTKSSKTATASAKPGAVDRTKPPVLPAPAALDPPVVQTQKLANGLELSVIEMHEVPVVDVILLVRAGAVRDPQDRPGLATFTANMLDEGAGKRSALDIAEEADFLGAELSTSASLENAQVRLHVPKRNLGAALDLMADVTLRPAFPDSEVIRQRELRKNALLQLRDQPTAIAPLAFHAIVFGPQHPYGRPTGGTEPSTAALDRQQVQRFYETLYRPGNARLLVVGDVTPAEARELIEARFGAWKAAEVPAPPVAQAPPPGKRTFYLVDKPGAAQSVVLIGHVGVPRSSPDYFTLRVLNTVLGGSFTSRLNQNLRETHGYTYGARSSYDMYRMAGPFRAGASVVTAKTDSSLIEFFKELRAIRDGQVPKDELEKAKAFIALGLPQEFETTQGTAGLYLDLLANDLPLDYYKTFTAKLQAVTAEQVQQAAQRTIDPDHFAVVVVGDRKEIESGIRALNEGDVAVRDIWGQPIP
jgi:predicted Zn-dependent peptidase